MRILRRHSSTHLEWVKFQRLRRWMVIPTWGHITECGGNDKYGNSKPFLNPQQLKFQNHMPDEFEVSLVSLAHALSRDFTEASALNALHCSCVSHSTEQPQMLPDTPQLTLKTGLCLRITQLIQTCLLSEQRDDLITERERLWILSYHPSSASVPN